MSSPSLNPPPSSTPPTSVSSGSSSPDLPQMQFSAATGRMKRKPNSPFVKAGGKYVRTIDMFRLPGAVIQLGLELSRSNTDEIELTAEERRIQMVYEDLATAFPNLEKEFNSFANISMVANLLQQGASTAKANDTDGIKKRLPSWWEKLKGADAPRIPAEKAHRGFNNAVTGRLLCPVDLDWDDPITQQSLRDRTATIDGQPVDGSDWPRFLYGDIYDPNIPWISFLRGPLLVMGYRHVFIAPSSNQTNVATNISNAVSYGMTEVTPASIAYIATQMYFALTEFATFNRNSKELDAQTLFNSLIEHMLDPDFYAFNQDLFEWWNRQIFPRAVSTPNKTFSSRRRIRAKLQQHNLAAST